jgi:type IV pilus assembly protein PilQ
MSSTNQIAIGWVKRAALRAGVVLVAWLALGLPAFAANVLQDVRYSAAPGGKVDITLQFAQPVGQVQAFTTDSPPRIAVDLPDTSNGLTQRRIAIGSGATSAVSAAEAGGRTRVVVDLFRPAGYTTRSAGNLLVITVDAGVGQATANTAMANEDDPSKRADATLAVANVDFRRGDNGSGRVVLRFSGDGAAADMRQEGNQIIVDVANASVPENLRRRLDVTDFATPVQSLEPHGNAGATRLVINTQGSIDAMAYQTGNEYVVEVSPRRGSVVAAAPGAGQASGAVSTGSSNQAYRGRPVTFNFQDVPVRTVLQLIADESDLNLVAADSVGGNVTLRLINVPWDQALDIVLRAKGLDKRRDGNVVWIAPQAEISTYEQAREDARIALENRAELVNDVIQINYHSATAIYDAIIKANQGGSGGGGGGGGAGSPGGAGQNNQNGFLSPRGRIVADERTNTILITDIPGKVQQLRELIAVIDRPVDQVLIEARVVIATESFARELGSRFGVSDRNGLDPGNPGTTTDSGFQTTLGPINAAGTFNLSILRSNMLIDIELSAMETEGRGEVLSNPRVITTNLREAIITSGQEVGYLTIDNEGGGTPTAEAQFKEALLELKVTPTITQDGRVYLNISVKKDEISGFTETSTGQIPTLSKRSISTAVLVGDGETVVIGGVYEFRDQEDVSRVPFLGEIPFLGNLFRNRGRSRDKAELLVFVTPRILQVAPRQQ